LKEKPSGSVVLPSGSLPPASCATNAVAPLVKVTYFFIVFFEERISLDAIHFFDIYRDSLRLQAGEESELNCLLVLNVFPDGLFGNMADGLTLWICF